MVEVASCQDQRKTSHRLYRARIVLVSQRSFQEVPSNSLTMTKGVNFSSCPDTFVKCYCEVNTVDGIMRATRLTEPCISIEGCISSNSGTFTFEGELDPGNNIDLDDVYENDDRERFEDTLCYSDSVRIPRRNLLQVHSAEQEDDYVVRENRLENNNFKDERGYRSVLRRRSGDEANYRNQDEEDDLEDEDEDGDDEKRVFFAVARPDDDDDDDDDDEDTARSGSETPKGRRIEEARSDYAAIAFEGKPEVDELQRNGHVQIRAAADDEECEDEATEILQYYDYESTGGTIQIGLALELVALSILFYLFLEI
ncbi:nuclear polyadenylated RNA-binding protein 3-like isoform X1 [Apis dorsata]|uniref:nuclear polyadenylated RNA-binding protein 3-like isoform X1 n=2 Tax=Apis dorsata TaxID=7462 RepID=UPI0012938C2A|nr:nuclear polyadenylated RNA-binding protein 3-like isoform X1 [Apis dorsata]